jgi:V/A-type H+-transporting ATPase subunit G/H
VSLEMVKEIRDAESKADQIKRDASVQARQIAQESQRACQAVIEKAKADAAAIRAEAIAQADAEAEEEGKLRRAKVAQHCKEISEAASESIDRAVSIIVERIIKG